MGKITSSRVKGGCIVSNKKKLEHLLFYAGIPEFSDKPLKDITHLMNVEPAKHCNN